MNRITLLLAAATFSHIFGYEHGGKFNPIFPLMFLGPGISGMLNIWGAALLFRTSTGMAIIGLLGSVTVGFGGLLAIYVMYVSMKQAKVQGDLKREALRQHRKQQREAQRGVGARVLGLDPDRLVELVLGGRDVAAASAIDARLVEHLQVRLRPGVVAELALQLLVLGGRRVPAAFPVPGLPAVGDLVGHMLRVFEADPCLPSSRHGRSMAAAPARGKLAGGPR